MSNINTTGDQRISDRITELLTTFRLSTAATELVSRITKDGYEDALPSFLEVMEQEKSDRKERRVERLRRASKLPPAKRFESFDDSHLPRELTRKLRDLVSGSFLDEAINVLAFGLPGTGKTHAASALGHAIVEAGHPVYFTPTFRLVQELLAAKRDLELPRALRKLDNYDLLILDDIGYVQQSAEEVEVLFTLMAERYERKSMLITSNLVFSQWDQIFKNPMTTAAAVDRIVHHSVILEFDVLSQRLPKTNDASKATTKKQSKKGRKAKVR